MKHDNEDPYADQGYPLEYEVPPARKGGFRLWRRRFAIILAIAWLIGAGWLTWHLTRRTVSPNHPPPARSTSPADIEQFYRTEIAPLLDASLQRNRRAADRAITLLHARFNAHHAGVKPFASDVSGWMTRFGVIGRGTADLWNRYIHGDPKANQVVEYIQGKFRHDVLSEQSLQADLDAVLRQFGEDVEASRNQLFAEMKLPLRSGRSPVALDEKRWNKLFADVTERTRQLNDKTPRDSVVTGLVSVAGGWLGAEAAEMIVPQIVARVGSAVAVEAAENATTAGGSAVFGGGATGGEIGSLGGPAGTAIGVGVGLAIGAAIDWWLSDRMEAQVSGQCHQFLDEVEGQIVEGGKDNPGLRANFNQAVRVADENQRTAIIGALLKEEQ